MSKTVQWLEALAIAAVIGTGLSHPASGPGARVGNRHLAFAKFATDASIRISPDLDAVADAIESRDCKLQASTAASLPAEHLASAQAYAAEYCKPWLKWWESVLNKCDGNHPPSWCDDEAAVLNRLDLDGYFATITSGLQTAGSQLERDNIMDLVVRDFHAHVITDFGPEPSVRWATDAAVAYLKFATPEEAITLARQLQRTWVGIPPLATMAFRNALNQAQAVTSEQRDELERILAERFTR